MESKKNDTSELIYKTEIYITELLCYTQNYKSTILQLKKSFKKCIKLQPLHTNTTVNDESNLSLKQSVRIKAKLRSL